VAVWAGAFLLAWGTISCLWMPWIDRARSYREVFAEMASQLPAEGCLAVDGLGESERAMLRYTTGVMPEMSSPRHDPSCDRVLVQGVTGKPAPLLALYPLRTQIWEGARPGDARERFWLLSRVVDVAGNFDVTRGHE
jgi:hypothetical protein